MSHSIFAPSSAKRWLECEASLLHQVIDDEGTRDSKRGVRIHELGEKLLKEGYEDCSRMTKEDRDNYSNEELVCANKYVKKVREILASVPYHVKNIMLVEFKTLIHPRDGVENPLEDLKSCYGTADCVIYGGIDKVLHVIDLKAGRWWVPAKENYQLGLYAYGILKKLNLLDEDVDIQFHIIQPTIDKYDSWKATKEFVINLASRVKVVMERYERGTLNYVPSTESCRFCSYRAECSSREDFAMGDIKVMFEDLDNRNISDADRIKYLEKEEDIIRFLEDNRKYMTDAAVNENKQYSGFVLSEAQTRRKWKPDCESLIVKILGSDAYKKVMVTITEAERKLGQSHKHLINDFIEKPKGEVKLVKKKEGYLSESQFETLD